MSILQLWYWLAFTYDNLSFLEELELCYMDDDLQGMLNLCVEYDITIPTYVSSFTYNSVA